jgi:hypothetical protein
MRVSVVMRYAMLVMALLIGIAWMLLVRQSGEGSTERRSAAREAPAAVMALLGDEVDGRTGRLEGAHVARLLRISLPGGAIEAERTLGPRLRGDPDLTTPGASALASSASLLAAAPDGQTVLALVRRPRGGRDYVAVIDATSLETRRRDRLQRGIDYEGLALGRSGRVYAYGVRPAQQGNVPALTILDASGAPIDSRTVRGRRGRDWWVLWAAPSADERRFMLTYHGTDTTGADWLDLSGGRMKRCEGRRRDRACVFEVHGAVAPFGNGFLATTGSGVIEVSADGRVLRRRRVKPRNIHLMDFVLDADRSQLYVSSCGKRPAIQRLDLASDRLEIMRSGRLCGAPFAVGAGFLVLAGSLVDRRGYDGDNPALHLIDLADPDSGVRVPRRGRPLDALIVGAHVP